MYKQLIRKKLAVILAALWGAQAAAHAGSVSYDFNTDPTGILQFFGNANYVPSGGSTPAGGDSSTNGFLQLTPNANGQGAAIVFDDFDNGQVVQGFTLSCDLRIGNGTGTPADGLSINYVRASDPLLTAPDPSQPGNWTLGPGGGQGPEEGSKTGIAICMDSYNNGPGDVVGFSVVVDGQTVASYPMPTINGACDDAASLQTGPVDANDTTETPLCWKPLTVSLDSTGVVVITWKGTTITPAGGLHTTFLPSPGRLVLGSRTGGLNEYHEIDNIKLTTVAAAVALVGSASGFPDGFSVTLNDSGSSQVDTNQITLKLNGTSVTPTSIVQNGGATTVIYRGYPNLLTAGSTNTVAVTAKDTNGNTVTGTRTFTASQYVSLAATDVVPANAIDTSKSGFRVRPWQSGIQPNAIYWTEEQLAGLHGANSADVTAATDAGYIDYTGLINFNIDAAANAGNFVPDDVFPGIPGTTGQTGNSSLEVLAYLQFPTPGVYVMGVNSDDGFKVTAGRDPQDRLSSVFGQFNGGRGSSDTLFNVVVPQAGFYSFRLVWENGNGEAGNGANLEWFTVAADGTKVLINDPSNPDAIKAYFGGPALPAYVSQLVPYVGETGARPDSVLIQFTDGATQVNPSTIHLSINGTAETAATSKTGIVTTAKFALTGANLLPPNSTNSATLVWSDSGSPALAHSNTWSFVTLPYVTLNPALRLSSFDTNQPGFTLRVNQLDPSTAGDNGDVTANNIESAESQLAGLYSPAFGENVADVSTAATNNVWYLNDPINYVSSGGGGNFGNDLPLPGIPGTTGITDMIAADFVGYADLQPGFYEMGVNSDDDFRLLESTNVSRQILHVQGGSINQDIHAVMTSTNNTSYGGSIPATPITAPLVYVDAASCPNVPNLAGKIALVDLHRCSDSQSDLVLAYQMQTNGAVAVVIVNVPSFGLAYVGSGSLPAGQQVTIPVLLTSGFNNGADVLKTNLNLTASIGADTNLVVGEFNEGGGRGVSDTLFGFVVPTAGAYPFRLVYENGNGGAAVEWFSVNSDLTATGYNTLINDRSTPGSILLYR
ncbi:MAG: hypothetical protein JWM99_4617, partial [Verrucomicrobiales bacterium]|nr:hypothetical protein [Verrucomicrobiales bacterium]